MHAAGIIVLFLFFAFLVACANRGRKAIMEAPL